MDLSHVSLGMTVAIFLLLFGTATAWSPTSPGITDGASLQKRAAWEEDEKNYQVTCVVDVENWTRYPLRYPKLHLQRGAVIDGPITIQPATREAFAVRIDNEDYRGTWGTASWTLDGLTRRFVILFTAMFERDNKLGVGLTRQLTDRGRWWDYMYYKASDSVIKFHTQPCSHRRLKSGRSCEFDFVDRNVGLRMEAAMADSDHPRITVKVKPTLHNWDVYAADAMQKYKPKP